MRIKLSELRQLIRQTILEFKPASVQGNVDYQIREIAKRVLRFSKNFIALKGYPSKELEADVLQVGEEMQQLLSKTRELPSYVYFSALYNDFKPLIDACQKLGRPALLGRGKYQADNIEAANKTIRQLQRFKKEVLDKQNINLVG